MPPSSSHPKADLRYRERLKEHKQAGYCAFVLSCKERRGEHQYCQDHRVRKNTKQRETRTKKSLERAATKALESFCSNLDVAPRASPPRFLRRPNAAWDKVIWVTFPDRKPLNNNATLPIQVFPEDHDGLGHDRWLKKAFSMKLLNTVSHKDAGYFIHQGLVTLLAAESRNTLSTDAYTWDWLDKQLKGPLLSDACLDETGKPLRCVLFLHWTTDEPEQPTLDEVYQIARNQLKFKYGTSFRVYPNESEAVQEREKLGDIGALDEVARSSPPKFAWRPKTCPGLGACLLRDCDKTVHKRAHSGCATHVRVVVENDRKHKEHEHVTECGERYQLTCDPGTHTPETPSHRGGRGKNTTSKRGRSSKKSMQPSKKPEHWFHQEIVPSLPSCEFRVFIATEPSEEGIRGRTGRVITIAKTAFVEGQALAVRKFLPEDLEPGLTQSDLESFALFIFRRLRERADSMVFFESLEVGVRLDIGVADNGSVGKSFFVNEITRWYGAHYFSLHLCAEPKTQICKAFGYAFSAFLNRSTGCVL